MMTRRRAQKGTALLEFALAMPFMVLITTGVFAFGVNVDQFVTVQQAARSAARLYSQGADLQSGSARTLLLKHTEMWSAKADSGASGVVYLTKFEVAASGSNKGYVVMTHRMVIGDPAFASSGFSSPSVTPGGGVSDYENASAARATLPAGVTISTGGKLHLAEVHKNTSSYSFGSLVSIPKMAGMAWY